MNFFNDLLMTAKPMTFSMTILMTLPQSLLLPIALAPFLPIALSPHHSISLLYAKLCFRYIKYRKYYIH